MVSTVARRVSLPLPSGMLWPAIVVFVLVTRCVVFLPGAGRHATGRAVVLPRLGSTGPKRFGPLPGRAGRNSRQDEQRARQEDLSPHGVRPAVTPNTSLSNDAETTEGMGLEHEGVPFIARHHQGGVATRPRLAVPRTQARVTGLT